MGTNDKITRRHSPWWMKWALCLPPLCFGVAAFAADADDAQLPAPATQQIDFTRDIKPILEGSCIRCHGPEKPRNKFRLDNRESALKGGDDGIDILPGNSLKSPLVRYVAGLEPDMQMPPSNRGDPLTTNKIALLRAWIDQGVLWEDTEPSPDSRATFSPTANYTFLNGNARKFREHYWQQEGWNGGLGEFDLWERTSPDSTFSGSGHILRNDYQLQFAQQKDDVGFIHYGWEQYRKYFDDSGGFNPQASPSSSSLNRDLHLDVGRAWVDFGLSLPNWPEMVLGYEYQYKKGEEANLQWGYATPTGKAINPASTFLNEHTHIIKFDLDHEIGGTRTEESFRGEFYQLATDRTNIFFDDLFQTANSFRESEGNKYFQGANTIRLERKFNDWLYGSAGYLYSKLNSDASANVNTTDLSGAFPANDWQSQQITLRRESHVANLNALLGPWDGLTVSSGFQGELTREQGTGSSLLNQSPIQSFSDYDTSLAEENLSLRYSGIPFTALFAEGRLRQERIGQSMRQAQDATLFHDPQFLLDTEFTSRMYDMRFGFDTSPWTWASLSAHYRRYDDDNHYNNTVDQLPIFGVTPGLGYPGFIRARDLLSDEVETKLVLRPVSWFKTTLTYKILHTDYRTDTDPVTFAAGIADISPGGTILAGKSEVHIYSINTTFTPHHRLYLSTTFVYQDSTDSTTAAVLSGNPSVVPYRGNIYSGIGSVTYVLTTSTDFILSYSFSRADYSQNNLLAGLPLGLSYQQHALQAGLTCRLAKNITSKLQYGFFHYDEPNKRGANNYDAHSILGMLTIRLR